MKDIHFYLPTEILEDLESFALVFLCTYKHGFLFLHIWSIASGQLWDMTLLWCGRNKTVSNHENSVPCGSLSYILVLDRLGGLVMQGTALLSVFNQKKRWFKIQHQMEVLNPIHIAPNMTALAKMTKRQKNLNINFALSSETWPYW